MLMKFLLCLVATFSISACVAPEEPVSRRVSTPEASTPSRVGFEDAPLPNHKILPASDSIIRLGH